MIGTFLKNGYFATLEDLNHCVGNNIVTSKLNETLRDKYEDECLHNKRKYDDTFFQ